MFIQVQIPRACDQRSSIYISVNDFLTLWWVSARRYSWMRFKLILLRWWYIHSSVWLLGIYDTYILPRPSGSISGVGRLDYNNNDNYNNDDNNVNVNNNSLSLSTANNTSRIRFLEAIILDDGIIRNKKALTNCDLLLGMPSLFIIQRTLTVTPVRLFVLTS